MLKQTIKKAIKSEMLKPYRQLLPPSVKKKVVQWMTKDKYKALVSVEELQPQFDKAWTYLSHELGTEALGDYLEFGVSYGTSLNCMYHTTQKKGLQQVRLFGFDSFEGMPDETEAEDEATWKAGQFCSSLQNTSSFLTKNGVDWQRTFLTKGWFSDTLTEDFKQKHQLKKASVIMVDCDIYSAAKEALNFSASLIKDVSIIVFDDWNSNNLADKNLGEKKAFNEFLAEHPHFAVEEFGSYTFNGKPNGKLFKITNTARS